MANEEHILDTTGLFCPEPVMMLHNKIRALASGERVRVFATDPSTQRDIPKFCNFLGHTLVEQTVSTEPTISTESAVAEQFIYLIQKG